MSHMMFADRGIHGVVQVPASALYKRGAGGGFSGKIRLPTDPIGTTAVTLSGVNANSEIRVYLSDTTELAGVELCVANQQLTWPVYATGSPNNTVRIVIIHPSYKIKEFTYTSTVGNQSIPIQQEPDKWYSNP